MTKIIATSVVRGSEQGHSHGGLFLIDLENQAVNQKLDWNKIDIDWQGRGWDRGLRGMAIHNDTLYVVASDELFAYDPDFKLINSWKNPFLKHCHEICVYQGSLFITSTGFDSILAFDLTKQAFHWALHIKTNGHQFAPVSFDPLGDKGPMLLNKLHINNVHCNKNGMYISGLNTGGLLHFSGKEVNMSVTLPAGTHNAQPFKNGVLFNDTKANAVRYISRNEEEDVSFAVPQFDLADLTATDLDATQVARAGFGRGLCMLDGDIIIAGSSPSTIALHDLNQKITGMTVTLTKDVRHAIHGLEIWPY
ncbi:hypothetical protein [Thalassotalea agarivorans]|uniref:Sugar lactone lactonase YvrE n=1 Tax=Thalassotalea agarivorans TaxID=349064 RepID=A0A1I0DP64_THASX|nr:hypothetical protein [Thalassotalea agarivorans]SET34156.1 hypothetical protein SAMN05660429_01597 [Thalassotalea agarivorans]